MAKIQQLRFFKKTSFYKATKEEFNTLLANKVIKRGVQLVFLLLSLNFIAIALFWSKIPPLVPLFYSRPRGYDQLVLKLIFPFLPLANLIIIVINLRLASFLIKKEYLLGQILVWSSLVITLMTSIAVLKILVIIV